MTVDIKKGSMFKSKADVLVNPVNCVGIMGAGVAKQFMQRYPETCKEFNQMSKNLIDSKKYEVNPGHVYPMATEDPRFIFMFTTKDHWRNPSKLEWIVSGLEDLHDLAIKLGCETVAMPAIGCGYGGLSWEEEVKPAIFSELENSDIAAEVWLL